ncbi:NAD(P)/FAD-dependent oxidoreductase [Desulfurivibrio alkaliphilus]|uniref:FAD-dependent pyridine nucleotide-disulfide oxidoreductase n=1 Tax=Desulfurivibrio alkaliphilus (strain DSM 19089 / UNIQEM U267 / AHT2) TaxID=589865 RepID=D6Z1I6_DESAT|nr:FAD-dependent oxidoreductase [Desulfurivibrio alkaliphilus]ADH87320.1 FAD-dependent pyridine nucleotide-disulfide oxidoreductase [Desulfurivibrio alkaliphilus AHT 2]
MKQKIVILGGSFGGLTAAFELRRRLADKAEITLLNPEADFVFLPSLPWVVTGRRDLARISLPLAPLLAARGINFVQAAATGVKPAEQRVESQRGSFGYDYLVIATGPHLAWEEIAGLGPEGGHTHCVFTAAHARAGRQAWQQLLSRPGPLILGSTQRASCFGPYYELAFDFDHQLRRRKLRHKVPITYVSSEPYPGHMGIDGPGRARRFIEDEFARRDIRVLTNRAVAGVEPGGLHLADGEKLPFQLAMLGPPFKGVAAVAGLGNERGFIPVDDHYRHRQHENIYAVGVAMALAPPEPTPIPTGVPKTGYMTVRMAKVAAAHLASRLTNQPPPDPEELSAICLMDMGNTAAFILAQPILPPRQRAVMRQGRWALWAKAALERYILWKMGHGISRLP